MKTGKNFFLAFLFCFYLTHVFLSQQKLIFGQLLTAFNIIHFIYKRVHNIYLTSIALHWNKDMHSKATNVSKQKGWQKTVCSRFISLPSWLEYAAHPCSFLDPGQNSLTVPKSASAHSTFESPSPWKSSWGSWIYCRWSKLCKRAQSQAKCSLTCQTGHVSTTSRRQNFSLFQSNSALGQINTRANKPWALVRCRESCSLLWHSDFFRPHIHKERHIFHCMFTYICTGL